MDDDQEEDIIFENSPLNHYLNEIGLMDAGTPQLVHVPARIKNETNNDKFSADYNPATMMNHRPQLLKMVLFSRKIASLVLASSLLEPEDQMFVNQLMCIEISSSPARKSCLSKKFLFALSIIIALCATTWRYTSWFNLCSISMAVTATPLFFWLSRSLFCRKYANVEENYSAALNSFLTISRQFDAGVKQLVRTVREREVLSHGYAIYSKNLPLLGSGCLSSQHMVLADVRKVVFRTLVDLFTKFRCQTSSMLSNVTLDGSRLIDYSGDAYLANVDLCKFAALNECEDLLTISTLKTCFDYLILQRSEFLRLLVVIHANSCLWPQNSPVSLLSSNLDRINLLREISVSALKKLNALMQLHSVESTLNRANAAKRKLRYAVVTDDCIRSLASHLQMALEKIHEERDVDFSDSADKTSALDTLCSIESILKSCFICIEEYRSRNNKGTIIANEDYTERVGNVVPPIESSQCNEVKRHDSPEAFFEDQVFEAIVSKSDHEANDRWKPDNVDLDNLDLKKSSQARKNLLCELNTVLSVRHKSMLEREKRALAKSVRPLSENQKEDSTKQEGRFTDSISNLNERDDSNKDSRAVGIDSDFSTISPARLSANFSIELSKALLARRHDSNKEDTTFINESDDSNQ